MLFSKVLLFARMYVAQVTSGPILETDMRRVGTHWCQDGGLYLTYLFTSENSIQEKQRCSKSLDHSDIAFLKLFCFGFLL